MSTLLKGTLATLGVAALAGPAAAQFGGPPGPPNTGVALAATLTGHAERPGPGDGSGVGRVTVVVDPPKGQLCYMFFGVAGIAIPTMAHIHKGGPDEAGGPVITLAAPVGGSSGGCLPVAADLAAALVSDPAAYYVNVHNADLPAGAIRGQLSK